MWSVSFKVGLHEVQGQETLDSKIPLYERNFKLRIGLKLGDWFLKLEEKFSWTGPSKMLQESDAIVVPKFMFHTLDPYPHVTSLGPKFCTQPVESLALGIFFGPQTMNKENQYI